MIQWYSLVPRRWSRNFGQDIAFRKAGARRFTKMLPCCPVRRIYTRYKQFLFWQPVCVTTVRTIGLMLSDFSILISKVLSANHEKHVNLQIYVFCHRAHLDITSSDLPEFWKPTSKSSLFLNSLLSKVITGVGYVKIFFLLTTVLTTNNFVHFQGTNPEIDSYSAFWDNNKLSETDLHQKLQERGIQDVYCCGIAYDVCVGEFKHTWNVNSANLSTGSCFRTTSRYFEVFEKSWMVQNIHQQRTFVFYLWQTPKSSGRAMLTS